MIRYKLKGTTRVVQNGITYVFKKGKLKYIEMKETNNG